MHLKKSFLYLSLIFITHTIFASLVPNFCYPSFKDALSLHIDTLLNAPTRANALRAYRALISIIRSNPTLIHNSETLSLLCKPLSFINFKQSIHYKSSLKRAQKRYAQELLKYTPSLHLTPSEALLLTGNKAMFNGLKHLEKNNPFMFSHCFERMMTHEKQLYSKGKLVVYHGTPRYNYALSYLHTKLHELFNGPTPGYLHTRQPLPYSPKKDDNHLRTQFLDQGGSWLKFNHAQQLLFCNCGLTANLKQRMFFNEDSLTFFTQEKTYFNIWKKFLNYLRRTVWGTHTKISAKSLFDHYHLSSLYTQFRSRIKQLLHFKAEGNIMLQIELDPNLAPLVVFPAHPIGKKAELSIDTQKTAHPLTIIETLKANPYKIKGAHTTIWCLILTQDLLLNPYHPLVAGNIQFHAYSMEQEKVDDVTLKIDQLIKDIQKERDSLVS